jgi:hypothetical protein
VKVARGECAVLASYAGRLLWSETCLSSLAKASERNKCPQGAFFIPPALKVPTVCLIPTNVCQAQVCVGLEVVCRAQWPTGMSLDRDHGQDENYRLLRMLTITSMGLHVTKTGKGGIPRFMQLREVVVEGLRWSNDGKGEEKERFRRKLGIRRDGGNGAKLNIIYCKVATTNALLP